MNPIDHNRAVVATREEIEPEAEPTRSGPIGWVQKMYERHPAQVLIVVSELALIAFFSLVSPYFLDLGNISVLLLDASVYILLALGLTFVIATGGIDLTPGFGMALTGVIWRSS